MSLAEDSILAQLIEQDRVPWYNKPNLRALYALMIPVCMGVEWAIGFDSAMMASFQTIDNWAAFFDYPSSGRLGFIIASYALGGTITIPLGTFVGDRFGRKVSVIVGSSITGLGALIQAGAQNFGMFILGRIVLGMGFPFIAVGALAIVGELAHPKERPILTSLFAASGFVGAIVAAGSALGTYAMDSSWSWRIPSSLQLGPVVLQLIFIWWMPESPRWLISKGRDKEAKAILEQSEWVFFIGVMHVYIANLIIQLEGNSDSPFVKAEMAQIQATLAIEQENKKMTWGQFFTTSGNRRRALIALCLGVFDQASGNNPIYFYLVKTLDQVGISQPYEQNAFNVGIYCWSLLNSVIFSLVVDKFKRRTMYLTSMIGMLVVYIMLTVSAAEYAETGTKAAGTTTLLAIILFSPFYNIAFMVLVYTYLVETFPFSVRAKGIAMFQFWFRTSSFINIIVNPIGMEAFKWKFYIWYCGWLAFEALCIYFLFPETRGRTLEELTFLFEGKEATKEMQKRTEYILEPSSTPDLELKCSNIQVENV